MYILSRLDQIIDKLLMWLALSGFHCRWFPVVLIALKAYPKLAL
jgi:hypothetical protein